MASAEPKLTEKGKGDRPLQLPQEKPPPSLPEGRRRKANAKANAKAKAN